MSQRPSAVLWDMDGTLVDTEPYWMASETALVESFGGTWTHDDALALVGKGLYDGAAVLRAVGVDMAPEAIVHHLTDAVREALRTQGVPFRPGARELLRELRDAGIPTALVTMSLRRMALGVTELIGFDAFQAVVAGDDVEHPKPHPEPYLRGAELLGVDIADAIVIEDSPTGLRAAVASGAVTLGVPHMVSLDGLGANDLWPSLDGRTLDDLLALFHAQSRRRMEAGT